MSIKVDSTGHVTAGAEASPVEIEFSDGMHIIPETVVAHLGGTKLLLSSKSLFRDKTYAEFMSGFWKLVEKSALNDVGTKLLQGHFMGSNPWELY